MSTPHKYRRHYPLQWKPRLLHGKYGPKLVIPSLTPHWYQSQLSPFTTYHQIYRYPCGPVRESNPFKTYSKAPDWNPFALLQCKFKLPHTDLFKYIRVKPCLDTIRLPLYTIHPKAWEFLTNPSPKAKGLSLFYNILHQKTLGDWFRTKIIHRTSMAASRTINIQSN